MSVARDDHEETAPGEFAAASPRHWSDSGALEGLEPQALSAARFAALSQPTGGGANGTDAPGCPRDFACDPFPCAARPCSALVGRAAGSQCSASRSFSREDQAVRHSSRLCCLTRPGDGLTRPSLPLYYLSSDKFSSPNASFWPVFLAFPRFYSSSALCAFHSSASAPTSQYIIPFCVASTHQLSN